MTEETKMTQHEARARVTERDWKPRNVVWELTLACNLNCRHCGSSAGRARPNELTLDESLVVARDLADLGAELVTLSGGEPTLKRGWDQIARLLVDRDVLVNMVTNGFYRGRTDAGQIAAQALDAGMCNVGISIDGTEETHEVIRGKGTFASTMESISTFAKAGLKVGVLTTVNRLNYPYLEQIRQAAIDAGATMWRLQIAKPMGEMKGNDDWVISPAQYMELIALLARLKRTRGIHLAVGDSLGYYGRHDRVLRGTGWRGRKESWQGCQAGMQAIGIEADGGVKGCLSLQAKWGDSDPFVEGNVRETPLPELWFRPGIFAFNRDHDPESLTGFCRECKYASLCRGGAKCVASSFLGHLHEDPYCYYRLQSLLNGRQEGHVAKTAAAAAAAFVISLGIQGCQLDEAGKLPVDQSGSGDQAAAEVVEQDLAPATDVYTEPDECCAPEYGVFPDLTPQPTDTVTPPDVQMDYGIPPEDAVSQPDVQLDYGIPPEDVVSQPDVQLDYGIPPEDVVAEPDAINCDNVCCDCEYGVIPEDVYKECCEPDPCANVCCDCDYGEPPPPECCD